jgi:DNA-binding transcriptional MerR regulator
LKFKPDFGSRRTAAMRIGELARRTSTNTPTIRYYESIGLMRCADRKAGGQRTYDDDDVGRLTFIRRCRDFGFSVEQVRSLVGLVQDRERSCTEARDLAVSHLQAVRSKLAELRALEKSIAGFVEDCDTACVGGPGPDCVVLGEMGSDSYRVMPRSAGTRPR